MHANSPILRRALEITGQKLTFKNHKKFIEDTIDKYYVRHPLGNEKLERLQFVVNLKCKIPADNKVWEVIDLHIVPKHDFKSDEYEICLDKAVPQPAHRDPTARALHEVCDALQVCTQEAKDSLEVDFQVLQEDGGTTKETLDAMNIMIEKNGFIPYDHAHPEFDRLKCQGLNLHNISCASLKQLPVRFPPASKRKRKRPDESGQSDSEDSPHSDECEAPQPYLHSCWRIVR